MLLYSITDGQAPWPQIRDRALAAARAGVDFVQLRVKPASAGELFTWARELAEAFRALPSPRARLLINDRLDIALAAGADGVHLPAAGLDPARVRAALDGATGRGASRGASRFWIAASSHAAAEVVAAARAGADFAVLGPIFATPSKAAFGPPLGLAPLRAAVAGLAGIAPSFPVLALGGITAENAAQCLAAGAAGVAAIRLFHSDDPAALVAALRSQSAARR